MSHDENREDVQSDSSMRPAAQNSKALPFISSASGAIAGGIVTSSPAITVAGGGGLAAYSAGLGSLIANAGCGSAAAIVGLSVVTAGPVLGGLLGYGAYKAIKGMRKQNGNNGNYGRTEKNK